jgi:CRISPR-associated protein Cas1
VIITETVYITQENCTVTRSERHLVLKKKGRAVATVPIVGLKTLVLLTETQITSHALNALFENGSDLIYMSKSGKIRGRLMSTKGGGAITRLAQHRAFLNPEFRLNVAKSIIDAKIHNQAKLIEKYRYYYPGSEYAQQAALIDSYSQNIKKAKNTDEIMGIEGICARTYWDFYGKALKEPLFLRRAYRPACDVVNAALNLGYAFLANEITNVLVAERFDIEIGFLHSVHYGRNSLALDIMEEFRSPFIDAWVLAMFNKHILKKDNFLDKSQGFHLTNEGFRKFCDLYTKRVEEEDWRERFRERGGRLKKAITAGTRYEGYYV